MSTTVVKTNTVSLPLYLLQHSIFGDIVFYYLKLPHYNAIRTHFIFIFEIILALNSYLLGEGLTIWFEKYFNVPIAKTIMQNVIYQLVSFLIFIPLRFITIGLMEHLIQMKYEHKNASKIKNYRNFVLFPLTLVGISALFMLTLKLEHYNGYKLKNPFKQIKLIFNLFFYLLLHIPMKFFWDTIVYYLWINPCNKIPNRQTISLNDYRSRCVFEDKRNQLLKKLEDDKNESYVDQKKHDL